jgi:hypothetical protein
MANDSSLLPSTPTPPAAATLTTSSAGSGATANNAIAYDYSPHLIRVVTALEQLSYSLAFIADKMDNVSDKLSDLARQSASQTSLLSTLSTNVSTLSTNSTTFTTAATGSGIHTTGPLDWVGLVSSYKLYVEDSGAIGLTALTGYKAKIDALPREF